MSVIISKISGLNKILDVYPLRIVFPPVIYNVIFTTEQKVSDRVIVPC